MTANPGVYTPLGIVLMDEPEGIGINTFAEDGAVLLSINARPGGNVGQIMLGLTANQALQLIERLSTHIDVMRRAVAEGKGGALFPPVKPSDAVYPPPARGEVE